MDDNKEEPSEKSSPAPGPVLTQWEALPGTQNLEQMVTALLNLAVKHGTKGELCLYTVQTPITPFILSKLQ